MKQEQLWRAFCATGSVESYLRYAAARSRSARRERRTETRQ